MNRKEEIISSMYKYFKDKARSSLRIIDINNLDKKQSLLSIPKHCVSNFNIASISRYNSASCLS